MGAIIFGENFMVRGQFSWEVGNFPRGQLSRGQFSISSGAIVRGLFSSGAVILGDNYPGEQFSSGAIVLEPFLTSSL